MFLQVKDSLLAVLQPFVADLIPADLILPNMRFHTLKILCLVDIDALVPW